MRWAAHVARMGEGRNALKILIGTPRGKIPLGRPKRRREENIRMDLKVMGTNTRNWVDSVQDRDYWRALLNAELSHVVSYIRHNFQVHVQIDLCLNPLSASN